jgi:tRNA/tmRNA/rRNA uracil-C5-methylase (TrmA/RlmC/RlmD family)
MGEWLGRDIDITVTGMAHGGFAVGRYDGRVVFVGDAIPGETVAATITDDSKASFWRADATSVIEASEHRVPHVWPEAAIDRPVGNRVGGADFGHIELGHQRALKREILRDSLVRFGKLNDQTVSLLLERVESLPGDDEANGLGWRTRVRLHVDDAGRVGPRARRSHRVVSVDSLPLATEGVNSIAPLGENYGMLGTVDVIASSVGDPRLIIGEQTPTVIRERVGDREFRVDDNGFWQVHRGAAESLTTAIRELIDSDRFTPTAYNLDLYGGVGLLASALAELGGTATRITSVESSERATEHAGENLAEWVGAFAETAKVERWLPALERRATPAELQRLREATVILDPPRAGAGKEVMSVLGRLAPAQIIYVACDPVALSRDIALAAQHGYRPVRLRALDMFPHTHHLETICVLVRD